MIINLPNLITFLRIPLAFAFLQENMAIRVCALLLAGLSDGLDGFIARRYKKITRFGTFLDPVADKFFVIVVLCVFLKENRIAPIEVAAMLGRDFSVFVFGCYLFVKGTLSKYQFRSIICGKITTALQFAVMVVLAAGIYIPSFIFVVFIVLGFAALIELYLERKKLIVDTSEI